MASSNVLPRRGAKLLSLHSHVSARAWNCRVQSLVTRKFLKNEGTIPKSWSLETGSTHKPGSHEHTQADYESISVQPRTAQCQPQMASSNVLPRRGAKLLSLHSHVSARAWNCRVQSLVTRKFLKNEGTIPKSWSLENRVLAETDCDFSASENGTDFPTA